MTALSSGLGLGKLLLALDRTMVTLVEAPRGLDMPVGSVALVDAVFIGVGLSAVWLGVWAAHIFAGMPTPIEPEAFKLVAALDVSIMVTALVTGGAGDPAARRRPPRGCPPARRRPT